MAGKDGFKGSLTINGRGAGSRKAFDRSKAARVGWLIRQRTYYGGDPSFRIAGEERPATGNADVELPVYFGLDYPKCPDCKKGVIEWAENGNVPGTRECDNCGSLFSDTRYGVHQRAMGREVEEESREYAGLGFSPA